VLAGEGSPRRKVTTNNHAVSVGALCDPGVRACAISRFSRLNHKVDRRAWQYEVTSQAQIGRLLCADIVNVSDSVHEWDWSTLLPVLQSVKQLRRRMCMDHLPGDRRTDTELMGLLAAARKARNDYLGHFSNVMSNAERVRAVWVFMRVALACRADEDRCVSEASLLGALGGGTCDQEAHVRSFMQPNVVCRLGYQAMLVGFLWMWHCAASAL
jgi:hypothetical protein